MTERISTATDPARVGDEGDEWVRWLDGETAFENLSDEDQARARRAGLA